MMANSLQLYRTLPLNDGENTQLFTFKLGLMNLDEFKSRSVRSTVINYQGQDWYLSCKYAEGKRHEFLGVYIYWGSPAEGVRCRADFRIITRNVLDPTKSLVTEGSQVEFSAPQSPGWGKREFAPLRELFTPGQGFLLEPEKIVIIELAMKSCSTLFEQAVDFAQLLSHREQLYPSFFTANFPLAGMEFYVSLYPLGDREEAEGNVSMYLHRFIGNENESNYLGCRIRFRFFLGHSRTCPSSSKTFEFSFKNEQGYGRFKAFEPLNGSDNLLFRGAIPLGVEIMSVTPFAQPEIRLTTRGYYHTDNFVFEDAVFPDHRGNMWRLSANSGSPFLSLRLNTEDKHRLFAAQGLVPNQAKLVKREECSKFLQWRAFILSRTDRKKTLPVNGCPHSAYYSRGMMQTSFNMSTNIPLSKAKALDGDYCTKEEPSLLVRIEFLNVQDLGVMSDYPTLDFERFQLYHTREGLKRCLKQNELLVRELESLHGRLTTAMKENRDSRDLVNDFQKLLKGESDTNKQQLSQTSSARPASISSSPTLNVSVQPPVPRPRGQRGPPPRPPPRAYSPVATDLVNTRQFTYSATTPNPTGSPSPTASTPPLGHHPPPPASSTGMGMVTDQQRLAVLNSNDTAFKRFSFTGINITPAMISKETSANSKNREDVPAQSSSNGKEPESPLQQHQKHQQPKVQQQQQQPPPPTTPTPPPPPQQQQQQQQNHPQQPPPPPPPPTPPPSPQSKQEQHQQIKQEQQQQQQQQQYPHSQENGKPPGAPSASSVVMSKMGNDGTARGFALARMTRPPVSSSQPRANQLSSQSQPSDPTSNRLSWPQGLSVHPPESSQSTGALNQAMNSPTHMSNEKTSNLSNGDIGTNSGLTNGFQTNLQQSVSSPNIASPNHGPNQKESIPSPTRKPMSRKITASEPAIHSKSRIPITPHEKSPSTEFDGFSYSPVPDSVRNRRSPVPEPISRKIPMPPVVAITNEQAQPNPSWPQTLPQNSLTQSSDSSLSQASIQDSVVSRNSTLNQNVVQEQAMSQARSTPNTPNKPARPVSDPGISKSTPSSPTRQGLPNGHQQHQQQKQSGTPQPPEQDKDRQQPGQVDANNRGTPSPQVTTQNNAIKMTSVSVTTKTRVQSNGSAKHHAQVISTTVEGQKLSGNNNTAPIVWDKPQHNHNQALMNGTNGIGNGGIIPSSTNHHPPTSLQGLVVKTNGTGNGGVVSPLASPLPANSRPTSPPSVGSRPTSPPSAGSRPTSPPSAGSRPMSPPAVTVRRKQNHTNHMEDLTKRLSIPSVEDRLRLGIIETSL